MSPRGDADVTLNRTADQHACRTSLSETVAATNAPVVLRRSVTGRVMCFGGTLEGRNLEVGCLILRQWPRSAAFAVVQHALDGVNGVKIVQWIAWTFGRKWSAFRRSDVFGLIGGGILQAGQSVLRIAGNGGHDARPNGLSVGEPRGNAKGGEGDVLALTPDQLRRDEVGDGWCDDAHGATR